MPGRAFEPSAGALRGDYGREKVQRHIKTPIPPDPKHMVGVALCKEALARDHQPPNASSGRVFDGAPGRQYRGTGTEKCIYRLLRVEGVGLRAMVPWVQRAGAEGPRRNRKR